MKTSKSQNRSHYIEQPTFEGAVPAELSADYILPDIYPDVKKLLRVTARPVLIGRFISGKRLEFSGAVDYLVLFSADTGDGESLHSVHFAGEWNSALGELEDLEHSDIYITPRIASCTARPSNPRKLSIRAGITSDVKVVRRCPCDVTVSGAASPSEELSLERLTESVPLRTVRTFTAEPFRMSENLETDAAAPAIDDIVFCSVSIHINEAKPRLDGNSFTAAVKGSAFVNCLYKTFADPRSYRVLVRTVPISYIVGADDYANQFKNCPPESLAMRISAIPVEVNAAVGEDSYGERRVLELDMTADVTVRILGAAEVPLTLDAYSTDRDSECTFSEMNTALPAKVVSANFSVSETVPKESITLPENASVIDSAVNISPLSLAMERGRFALSGTAAISCVYIDGDGCYGSAETALPIRCEVNVGELSEPFAYMCDATASDIRCSTQDGKLCVDFEVSLCAEVWEQSRRRVLESIRLTGESTAHKTAADITICYPSRNESMWEIAKRYGTSVAAIEAANEGAGRVLMIPHAVPQSFVM